MHILHRYKYFISSILSVSPCVLREPPLPLPSLPSQWWLVVLSRQINNGWRGLCVAGRGGHANFQSDLVSPSQSPPQTMRELRDKHCTALNCTGYQFSKLRPLNNGQSSNEFDLFSSSLAGDIMLVLVVSVLVCHCTCSLSLSGC